MRRIALALVLIAAACSSTAPAGPQPGTDEFAIETTVLAAYNVVSGPAGRRDWNRFKELFEDHAQIVAGGTSMTPEDFQKMTNDALQQTGLFEHPVRTHVDRYKDIAHVWSEYESRHATTDAQPFQRGVRSFQLVRSGDRWVITSMVMQPE